MQVVVLVLVLAAAAMAVPVAAWSWQLHWYNQGIAVRTLLKQVNPLVSSDIMSKTTRKTQPKSR